MVTGLRRRFRTAPLFTALTLLATLIPGIALAEGGAVDSGDTAWILTSSALVLLMTLPGLALFYGGLVRVKNILSVLMQCMMAACSGSWRATAWPSAKATNSSVT